MGSCKKLEALLGENLPFSLDWLPSDSHLVGGAVRDALLDRQKYYLDLDFVLPEAAISTARKIANHYHGGFVILDEMRQIARVVFGRVTVDFAQQEGGKLEEDLKRRDFTVNAIAFALQEQVLIDPLQGLADLAKKSLRMVSEKNLADDPLRLLRAYRQAAQLNFTIAPSTRVALQNLAPLISKVAAERVQSELNYLLKAPLGQTWLEAARADGLLLPWLASINAKKLSQATSVEKSAQILEASLQGFVVSTEELHIAKLSCLVSSIPEVAAQELSKLKYSRHEIKAVTTVLKSLPDLLHSQGEMSLGEQYFFFLKIGKFFPIIAIIAEILQSEPWLMRSLGKRYQDAEDAVAHPRPLVSGHDLIQKLNLTPSPMIGKILMEIQLAQIEGRVTTFAEALRLAQELSH